MFILISVQSDNEYYKKKYGSSNENETDLLPSDKVIKSSSNIVSLTIFTIKPSIVLPIASSSALITSIAILNTNEYVSI